MEFFECPCCQKLLVKERKLNVLKLLDSSSVEEILIKFKLNHEELAAAVMREYVGKSRDKIRAYFLVLGAKKKEMRIKTQSTLPVEFAKAELRSLASGMAGVVAPKVLTRKVIKNLTEIMFANYMSNLERIENELDMTFKPNMEAVRRIQKYNFNLIKTLNKNEIDKLRGVISRGLISGSNLRSMQQEMMKQVDVTEYSAERIVRTENLRVANFGYYDGAMRSKLPGKFMWIATGGKKGDGRTSDICKLLHGKTIDKDDPESMFHITIGKYTWTGRFPPAHPNCRSGLKFIPKL